MFFLRRERIPVSGRMTFENIGHVDIVPGQSGIGKKPVKDLAGRAYERYAGLVFIGAGSFGYKHEFRLPASSSCYGLQSAVAEGTSAAAANKIIQLVPCIHVETLLSGQE